MATQISGTGGVDRVQEVALANKTIANPTINNGVIANPTINNGVISNPDIANPELILNGTSGNPGDVAVSGGLNQPIVWQAPQLARRYFLSSF